MPNKCAFCPGSAKITGEHVWSAWINELFPIASVTFRTIQAGGSEGKPWTAPQLNLKTRVVCETCNNTWMSDIENNYAKPAMCDLILGKRLGTISKKRAHGLSLFAFKTAVVANRSLPESEFFFDQSDRFAFRESFSIPRDVGMWLVGVEPFAGGTISIYNVRFPNLSLNVCTFSIGQLGFQTVAAKSPSPVKIESLPTPPGLTLSFYPPTELHVRWPRPKVLGIQVLNDFTFRWATIRRV